MIEITTANAHEYETHRWGTSASDIGLRVGDFPNQLPTSLGNGLPFEMVDQEIADGDLLAVRYRQQLGIITLTVEND